MKKLNYTFGFLQITWLCTYRNLKSLIRESETDRVNSVKLQGLKPIQKSGACHTPIIDPIRNGYKNN